MKAKGDWYAVGLLILVGLFLSAPLLFFGMSFAGEEHMGFYYAISFWVHQALQAGAPLVWQSAYYGGVSASLDQFVGAFYPVNQFLFSAFPFFLAHHLSIFLATTLGLLLSYWFGRVQGWKSAASILFSFAYLSATTYAWLSIGTTAAHSFAMLPALMLSLWYVAHKGDANMRIAFFILWGGLSLGIGMLAGFMQIVFYNICIAGAYALFLDWSHYTKGMKVLRALRTSLSYAIMTLTGLLVGIWQFYPSASLIALTIRTSDYAIQNRAYPTPFELIAFFIPPYTEIPFLLSGGQSAGFYIGAVGLLFAALSLTHYRSKTTLFFAGLYLLIAALGFRLPIFGWLNDHIPPFSHMGGSLRWMVPAAFPLAYLVGRGVDGFLRDPARLGKQGWRVCLFLVGIVIATAIVGSLILSRIIEAIHRSPDAAGRIIEWYSRIHPLTMAHERYLPMLSYYLQKLGAFFSLSDAHYLFSIGCFAALFCAMILYTYVPRSRAYAAGALVVMMTLTVLGTFAFQWRGLAPQHLYETTPPLASILKEKESNPHAYRIMGYLIGDSVYKQRFGEEPLSAQENTRMQLELLINNSNIYWGIERIDGLEPYRTLRANQLLNTVIGYDYEAFAFDDVAFLKDKPPLRKLYNRDAQRKVTHEEKLADFEKRLPILSMLNVAYVYSLYPLRGSGLASVTVDAVHAGSELLPLYLYENKNVLPRVYMAQSVRYVGGTDSEVLAEILGTQDFSKETLIECNTCTASVRGGDVRVLSYQPGKVVVEVDSKDGGYLVLSESGLPGWVARVDRVSVPIYKTNYLFQSVYVPPGVHVATFEYHDITKLKLQSLLSSI